MPALGRLILPLALLLLSADPTRGEQPVPSVTIAESDPALFAQLGNGETLYLRLAYRGDVKLRFRAEGYAAGKNITAGAMYNPAPVYPAGEGEALAWIAYRGQVTIDALKITILDEQWRPLAVVDVPAQLRWTAAAARPAGQRAAWAQRLNREQQESVSQSMQAATQAGGGWMLLGLQVCVLGYIALQALTAYWFSGRWRIAALAPLIVAIPVVAYTFAAAAAGSNLWPLALLLLAPLALVYLLGLLGVRLLARVGGA
jgi:hypothetical protein